MQLIFFQICLSPHQLPYIKELPKHNGIDKVVIVVPTITSEKRERIGWDAKSLTNIEDIEIRINPSNEEIENLYQLLSNDDYLFFSGINAFPDVTRWMKISLKYDLKRAIITECPNLYKRPLFLHAIRFLLKDLRFVKHFNDVFLIGEEYIWYYRLWSKKWNIHNFIYCTEWQERFSQMNLNQQHVKMLFVGSLIKLKNVGLIFNSLDRMPEEQKQIYEIGIVGDGPEREELQKQANKTSIRTVFYGSQPMNEVQKIMQEYDVLILPSLYDGWGAVVNEALTLGLYVICSDACGAKDLLKDPRCGSVFKRGDSDDLKTRIINCAEQIDALREDIPYRIDWARKSIKGDVVAKYLVDILCSEPETIPWIDNNSKQG